MEPAYTYTVTNAAGKSKDIEGETYAQEANGALSIRDKDGNTTALYAPGQWSSIESEKNDGEKPKRPASKKAEKDAANLTDEQRQVQDTQERAQGENPYTSKVDFDALHNADNEAVANEGVKDTNTNPPNADKRRK